MIDFPYQRIVVVGTTSSGKSTLANRLAQEIKAEYIELDALNWEPNWVAAPIELFRSRVQSAIQAKKWVAAGNYHTVRDLLWDSAQVVIWLDYPFLTVFWRLFRRTLRRLLLRENLWGGNRESLWTHLKLWSQDSLFHWLMITYWRRKREYPMLFALPEYSHLHVIHFKHPSEVETWLSDMEQPIPRS